MNENVCVARIIEGGWELSTARQSDSVEQTGILGILEKMERIIANRRNAGGITLEWREKARVIDEGLMEPVALESRRVKVSRLDSGRPPDRTTHLKVLLHPLEGDNPPTVARLTVGEYGVAGRIDNKGGKVSDNFTPVLTNLPARIGLTSPPEKCGERQVILDIRR